MILVCTLSLGVVLGGLGVVIFGNNLWLGGFSPMMARPAVVPSVEQVESPWLANIPLLLRLDHDVDGLGDHNARIKPDGGNIDLLREWTKPDGST
jgi:hypothetical protein